VVVSPTGEKRGLRTGGHPTVCFRHPAVADLERQNLSGGGEFGEEQTRGERIPRTQWSERKPRHLLVNWSITGSGPGLLSPGSVTRGSKRLTRGNNVAQRKCSNRHRKMKAETSGGKEESIPLDGKSQSIPKRLGGTETLRWWCKKGAVAHRLIKARRLVSRKELLF